MTITQSGPRRVRPWTSALASLLPWAGFFLGIAIADVWVEFKSVSLAGLAAGAPLYLPFVALPSLLPLLAARAGVLWFGALAVMTAVAASAGVLVVTTDDAQAGLAVLWVPYVAIPLAAVVWVGQAVAARRATERQPDADAGAPAGPSDRLAALAIDVAIVGAVLVVPLTAISHAKQDVAAGIVGIAAATIYLGALVAARGRTVGHSLLKLTVVDAQTRGRVGPARALLRSLIVVVEVAAAPTIVFSPAAFAELMSVIATGRSLADRLLRTAVVTTR